MFTSRIRVVGLALVAAAANLTAAGPLSASGIGKRLVTMDTLKHRLFPLVVNGMGMQSEFRLISLDTAPQTIDLYFLDHDGDSVAIPIEGIGTVEGVVADLPAGGTVTIRTTGQGELQLAYGLVFNAAEETEIRLGATFLVRHVELPAVIETPVAISEVFERRFVVPYDGKQLMVRVVNLAVDETASVSCSARDEHGRFLRSFSFRVEPFAVYGIDTDDYPDTFGNFRGAIECRNSTAMSAGFGVQFVEGGSMSLVLPLSLQGWND